jgi:hypothetical protein
MVALMAACGGKAIDVGASASPGTSGGSSGSSSGSTSPGGIPLVSCDDAGAEAMDAGTCQSSCCSPPVGNDSSLTSISVAVNGVLGRWQICTSLFDLPSDVIGVELDAPPGWDGGEEFDGGGRNDVEGTLEFLVQGPSGPEPGQGFAYNSTWDLTSYGLVTWSLTLGDATGGTTQFLYSACPRQLELQLYDLDAGPGEPTTTDVLLVPF